MIPVLVLNNVHKVYKKVYCSFWEKCKQLILHKCRRPVETERVLSKNMILVLTQNLYSNYWKICELMNIR